MTQVSVPDDHVLRLALMNSLEVGVPAFVLIDPLGGEPLPVDGDDQNEFKAYERQRAQAWQRPVYRVPLDPSIELPMSLHPYLVGLDGLHDSWLAATLEVAVEERRQARADGLEGSGLIACRIGGWLCSSLDPHALTQALARLMLASANLLDLPVARDAPRYIRLGDARVLGWLGVVAGVARLQAALGSIQSWAFVDSLGELSILRAASEDPQSLGLTRGEWSEFMLGSLLHPTLARWLGPMGHPPGPSHSTLAGGAAQALRQARLAVAQAQAAAKRWPVRFARPDDLTAWAALSLHHPGIDKHQGVADLMQQEPPAGEPQQTVHALCGTLAGLCMAATRNLPAGTSSST